MILQLVTLSHSSDLIMQIHYVTKANVHLLSSFILKNHSTAPIQKLLDSCVTQFYESACKILSKSEIVPKCILLP